MRLSVKRLSYSFFVINVAQLVPDVDRLNEGGRMRNPEKSALVTLSQERKSDLTKMLLRKNFSEESSFFG